MWARLAQLDRERNEFTSVNNKENEFLHDMRFPPVSRIVAADSEYDFDSQISIGCISFGNCLTNKAFECLEGRGSSPIVVGEMEILLFCSDLHP
jgi:hypothetical protein